MSVDRAEQVLALIERLANEIELAQKLALGRTAYLLRMTKLDLQMTLYSISNNELRHFTLAVAKKLESETVARNRKSDKCKSDEAVGGSLTISRARKSIRPIARPDY